MAPSHVCDLAGLSSFSSLACVCLSVHSVTALVRCLLHHWMFSLLLRSSVTVALSFYVHQCETFTYLILNDLLT